MIVNSDAIGREGSKAKREQSSTQQVWWEGSECAMRPLSSMACTSVFPSEPDISQLCMPVTGTKTHSVRSQNPTVTLAPPLVTRRLSSSSAMILAHVSFLPGPPPLPWFRVPLYLTPNPAMACESMVSLPPPAPPLLGSQARSPTDSVSLENRD